MQGKATILILPTQQIGKSTEHIAYPGTLTLCSETLTRLWTEIGESVARAGLRKIVFLNSHGGQPQVAEIVARALRVRCGMMAVAANWWSVGYPDELVSAEERRHGIHAGQVETAMMLHLAPDLVRMDRAKNFIPAMVEIESLFERLRVVGPMQIGWMAQDVHPDGAVDAAARALAARLLSMDPLTLATTKGACDALANAMVPKEVTWSDPELMLLAYRQQALRDRSS